MTKPLKTLTNTGAALALACAAMLSAAPAAAHDGYGRYERDDRYAPAYPGDRYGRYEPAREWRHDRGYREVYNGYRGDNRFRCSDGSTGTIVGAIAGGLLGSKMAGRRGDQTAGVIIGGALGAVAGRAIDKDGNGCR